MVSKWLARIYAKQRWKIQLDMLKTRQERTLTVNRPKPHTRTTEYGIFYRTPNMKDKQKKKSVGMFTVNLMYSKHKDVY